MIPQGSRGMAAEGGSMGSTDRLAMVAPPWDEVRAVAAHAFEAGIMAVAPPVSRPETRLFRLAMELAVSGAEPETIMELLDLLLLSSGNRSAPTNAGKIFQFSTDPDFERKLRRRCWVVSRSAGELNRVLC